MYNIFETDAMGWQRDPTSWVLKIDIHTPIPLLSLFFCSFFLYPSFFLPYFCVLSFFLSSLLFCTLDRIKAAFGYSWWGFVSVRRFGLGESNKTVSLSLPFSSLPFSISSEFNCSYFTLSAVAPHETHRSPSECVTSDDFIIC